MDIVSHGLWGAIAFGRRTRSSFWLSFVFGIAPDFVVRHLDHGGHAGAGRAARFQSWDTSRIVDPSVCPSSVQCHAQLSRVSRRVSFGVGLGETAGLGAVGVGTSCAHGHPVAFVRIFPDALSVADL